MDMAQESVQATHSEFGDPVTLWDTAKQLFHEKIKGESGDLEKVQQFLRDNTTHELALESCETARKKAESKYSTGYVTIGGKELFLRKRLASILKKVQMFVQFGDIAIQHNPETTSLIWAAFRMMLHVAITDIETCELLTDACEEISGTLFACAVYEKRYKVAVDIDDNDKVAVKVIEKIPPLYAVILELSYEARKFLDRDKFARFLRSGAGIKFRSLVDDIKKKIQEIHTTAGLAFHEKALSILEELYKGSKEEFDSLREYIRDSVFTITNETSNSVQEIHSNQKKQLRNEEQQRLEIEYERNLKWLDRLEDLGSEYRLNLERRQQTNTCSWIFDQLEYKNWYESGSSGMLWISGNAGFGKSVLLSAIIEKLRSEDDSRVILFFFCKTGDDNTQRAGSILRNLIAQLYRKPPDISPELMERYTKIIAKAQGTKKSETDYAKSVKNLKKIAEEMIGAFEKQIFIVIDAVDECNDRQQEGLLSALRGLVGANLNTKILLASRPETDIDQDLEGIPKVELGKDNNNSEDIRAYVAGELKKLTNLKTKDRKIACKVIIERSAGMFRYANLAIDRLKQPWRPPLKNHLDSLPDGLEAFYRQRFEQIKPELQEILIVALRWTILANGDITALIIAEDYMRIFEADDEESEDEDESESESEDEDEGDGDGDGEEEDGECEGDGEADKGGKNAGSGEGGEEGKDEEEEESEDLKKHNNRLEDTLRHIKEAGSVFLEVVGGDKIMHLRHSSVKDFVLREKERTKIPVGHIHQQIVCQRCKEIIPQTPRIALDPKIGHLTLSLTIFNHLNSKAFLKLYLPKEGTGSAAECNTQIYEFTDCMYHLREAGRLWTAEERRESEDWKRLWVLVDNFFENTPAFNFWQKAIWSKLYPYMDWDAGSNGQPIHVAASYGLMALAERLLDNGADVNIKMSKGYSALHLAAGDPEPDMVELLLQRGAIVDILDDFHFTPLCGEAVWTYNGNPEITKLLLKHGADPNIPGDAQRTALHGACFSGNFEVFQLLIAHGANDVKAKDSIGETPLHYALGRPNPPPELIKELIKLGADVNDQDNESQAPLYEAAFLGSAAIVEILLDSGAEIDDDDIFGTTALHAAADEGYIEIVTLLAERGANLNVHNKQGETPLSLAAGKGRLEIVRYLLQKLATHGGENNPLTEINIHGVTALYKAAEQGHAEIVMMLLETNSNNSNTVPQTHNQTLLHIAARHGHIEVMMLLQERGARLDVQDERGDTPFSLAAQNGRVDIVRYLLQRLTTDNKHDYINATDAQGKTALHKAVESGHIEVVTILLEADDSNSTLQAQDHDQQATPLHLAASQGHQDIMEILIKNGSDTNAQTLSGETPFDLALGWWLRTRKASFIDPLISLIRGAKTIPSNSPKLLQAVVGSGDESTIKELLELGINPNGTSDDGWTPILTALHCNKPEIIEVLKSCGANTLEFPDNGDEFKIGDSPTSWNPALVAPPLSISEDGLELSYGVEGVSHSSLEENRILGSVIANHVMPAGKYLYYFEVEVVEGSNAAILGIGICQPGAILSSFPGWTTMEVGTYAYHGDDGKIYSHKKSFGDPYGKTWGLGDIVGCGVDFRNGSIFFTKNGEFLGVAFTGVQGEFYPVFGMEDVALVRVNFGQDQTKPFRYKAESFLKPAETLAMSTEVEVKE